MRASPEIQKWQTAVLWAALFLYAQSRICQLYPERISIQLIVFMHVVPPAIFALVHGSILYGVKGMSAFTAFCLGGLSAKVSAFARAFRSGITGSRAGCSGAALAEARIADGVGGYLVRCAWTIRSSA
jgi:hypothetical protein